MKIFSKLITFLKEVKTEMKKVNWPTKQETLRYTLIILAISVAVAAFLGGLDYIFSILLNREIKLGKIIISSSIIINLQTTGFIP